MVEESHMRRVIELVWNATLGLDVGHWDDAIIQPDINSMLAGYLSIAGAWQGIIAIHISLEAARQAAAIMFTLPLSRVSDADAKDALGELANQVAGNLKILLPGENRISLPTVCDGRLYVSQQPDRELLMSVAVECDGLPMMVTLVEALPSREAVLERYHSMMAT